MTETTPDPPWPGDHTTSQDRAPQESTAGGKRNGRPPRRIGVLSLHNSKETKAILNAIEELGHDPVWIREENFASWIDDGTVHVEPAVDALVNRLLVTKRDRQYETLQLAALYDRASVPVLNPPTAVHRALHKYSAGARLAAAELPVPDAFYARSPRQFDGWDDRVGHRTDRDEDVAVQKPTIGTNGQGMALVSPGETVSPRVGREQTFLQQRLEDGNDRPSDVRVYVVGDRIVGAMRRHAPDGDWRTNVALGGAVTDVTDQLGTEPKRLAREATNVLGLDVAGVDLMPTADECYVLEVNATAGFKGLFSATGRSAAPYIARLAIERAGDTVDPSSVETLASTLDDAVPDCKPPLGATANTDGGSAGVLGYTTEVAIAGTDGVETAIAKSDSGARRTSLDTGLAGRVGAGPLVGTTGVRSAAGSGSETRPLVDVELQVNDEWRTVRASLTDRSQMNYPVLLGRDVLADYTLEVGRTVEE